MDATPNLDLPYIMGAQAQKHVTHNEAIRKLDALVHLAVLDRDLTAPPGSPSNGDRYIVAAAPSGAWTGHDLEIAALQDGAWAFYAPAEGWLAWVADESALVAWDGSAWIDASATMSLNPAPLVGINTTADDTNRLAVKSDAVLFSHDDVTPGSGDQRTVLNKSATNKTASFLFQSNWSGRAEIGLAGNDDFSFKVSADGAAWHDALVLKKDASAVVAAVPMQHAKPPRLPVHTRTALPSAATYGAGSLVYVSDWPSGGAVLTSDGVVWRRVSPRRAGTAEILAGDEGIAIDWRARKALINDYTDALSDSGRPAGFVALTRASDAAYIDREDTLEFAGSNTLRYHYDPITREPRGLLLEGAATNLLQQSLDLTASPWTSGGSATRSDGPLAPDGISTWTHIAEPASLATPIASQNYTVAAEAEHWSSIYVKAAERSRCLIQHNNFANYTTRTQAVIDLVTGEVVAYGGGGSPLDRIRVTPGPQGSWRIAIWGKAANTAATRTFSVGPRLDDSTDLGSYTGDGSSGILAWGGQVEVLAASGVPSSLIPTTSGSATRAADSLVIGPGTFPVPASGDCTIYWRGRLRGMRSTGAASILSANDGSGGLGENIALREGIANGGVDAYVEDGGAAVANTAGQVIALGAEYAFAVSVRADDLKFFANGVQIATDTSLTVPTIDRLTIAPNAGSIYEIDEIAYIARALGAGELAALTS